MPDVVIEKPATLDILTIGKPATSAVTDVPVIETKPDATNTGKPPEQDKAAPAEEKSEEGKTDTEESATSPEESPASDEPKKAKGVQKRLDELTRQREEAKRQAESERQEKLRLLALLEEKQKPKVTDEDDAEPVKPAKDPNNPDAYETALDDYIVKKSEWIARREVKANLAAERKAAEETRLAEQSRQMQQAYTGRVEKAMEKYPDYKDVAESPDVQVSIPMAHAIAQAEDGPEIAYFLGKNPTEAERISKLAPPLQLVELGKISARLATPAATKPVSAAPAPGKPIKATTETTKTPEEMSMEEYAAKRKKDWADERRPGGARH